MTTPYSLAGETAVITGGGTGLGLGIARAFVASGARVVLVGRRRKVLEDAAWDLGALATWELQDIANDQTPGLGGGEDRRSGDTRQQCRHPCEEAGLRLSVESSTPY
jgi:NAD(P)-dependent dehydrogenase (short-subunit alcohol dehydrogenase family)